MIHFGQSLPAEAFYHVPLHCIMRESGCQFQNKTAQRSVWFVS